MHAPLRKASRRQKRIQRNPWLTKGLLTSIKHKQKLYRTHFLNGDALSINFFKTYSNKLTRVKTLSKKMYYNSTINKYKNKPEELWKFINSVIPNKHLKNLSISKLIDDGLVTDELTEISIFLFSRIFTLLSRESDQCAIRARLGVASHLSTTPRRGNPAKCLSQRHNK